MILPELRNVNDIMNWLKGEDINYDILGYTDMEDPILVIKKPGRGKPVLITSGAHAGEPAGVFASLMIAKNFKYDNPLYVVPLRDPFGFQGYEACLSYALKKQISFSTHDELFSILKESCSQILYEDDSFMLADVNGILFTNQRMPDKIVGPRGVELRVNALLQDRPDLVEHTRGKRIVFPSNAGQAAENVWNFYRAFSAEITPEGIVADMNRRFGTSEEPKEVRYLRQLCDELKPPVVLDLHEGQGSSYYFFVPDFYGNREIAYYAEKMLNAVMSHGEKVTTLHDVAERLGSHILDEFTEALPGILVDKALSKAQKGSGFSTYAGRYGAAITVECGRWAPLKNRVQIHLWAAEAMLESMSDFI